MSINWKIQRKLPGYVIDYVNPLECGGADARFNMQWQTIADGKAKIRSSATVGCERAIEHSESDTERYSATLPVSQLPTEATSRSQSLFQSIPSRFFLFGSSRM
jgi:hypothetical protein